MSRPNEIEVPERKVIRFTDIWGIFVEPTLASKKEAVAIANRKAEEVAARF